MKTFLTSVVIFSLIFFAVDKCFIVVRNASADQEADKRLEQIITGKIDADILIYGSSRGARNVIASQIGDSLHRKVFNLSYPGSDITFHDYLLQQTLANNRKPEMVILVVDGASELLDDASIKFRFDRLFPLVKYPAIRETLVEKGMKNRLLSRMFVLSQLNFSNFLLYKKKFSPIDTVFADGSMPVSFQSPKFTGIYDTTPRPYNIAQEQKAKLASFTSFVDQCSRLHIPLVLAFPPNYFPDSEPAIERLKQLTAGRATWMFYDSSRPEYRDPAYYYDFSHLQRNGATIFTGELAHLLKQLPQGLGR